MNAHGWLAVYSGGVLLFSMAGGWLPFLGKVTHGRLQLYLSASAGVMLGAAFFHVIPEAIAFSGGMFGWWMSLGVVGLFCIERFIAPHTHEVAEGHMDEHAAAHEDCGHPHKHDHDHGDDCGHDHAHDHVDNCAEPDHHAAAPALSGWMAVFGLTLHTFMNGVGLGGAVIADLDGHGHNTGILGKLALPGFALFLAIALHKPADALAVSMMLSRKGVSRAKVFLVQIGFALMVPIGAFAFLQYRESLTAELQGHVVGAALAFSAGTFLFIALSDLLPEVQFHTHDRAKLFAALLAGVVLMGLISYLEGHDHGGGGHGGHDHGAHDHGHAH